ncbi:hypothetical protein [Desulfitobacterium sp. AusDCA]|uniref:hypothetical protein n=1 Tax=Desulfitobacterium sp. AusDCA TaxID=3240383 RepID=UPI003DA6E417
MRNWRLYKQPILLVYMALNFALLNVDVLISHSQNRFFRLEMIPIIYGILAVISILLKVIFSRNRIVDIVFQAIMWLGIGVGVIGTYFHLAGNATSKPELLYRLLVTGSPVAAPIAFSGVAMFTLISGREQMMNQHGKQLALVGWGFIGAVLAAYLDHARLNFIPIYTIFPLIAGIMAGMACFWFAYTTEGIGITNKKAFLGIMGLNLVVGLIGFIFHVIGDLSGTQTLVLARFLYRDPLMGPLLFCNLAVLGTLSLLFENIPETDFSPKTSFVSE